MRISLLQQRPHSVALLRSVALVGLCLEMGISWDEVLLSETRTFGDASHVCGCFIFLNMRFYSPVCAV